VLRAVTFDFWNTLMWEEPGSLKVNRLAVWADAFRDLGIDADPLDLERAHDAAHQAYVAAWESGTQFRVEEASDRIAAALWGPGSRSAAREALLEGFSEAGRRAAVHPSDGVALCLRSLSDAGVRLGIICDIGLTPSYVVRELLDRHDLLGAFDGMSFSDEVGHYKPAPEIFEHALRSVGGGDPGAAAHVGDRRRTDVGGALAAGWTAVRYNGVYEDPVADAPEGDLVVGDLAELPDRLGVPAHSS
jgi:FMN phosphatase YigB (HAD superfamily)